MISGDMARTNQVETVLPSVHETIESPVCFFVDVLGDRATVDSVVAAVFGDTTVASVMTEAVLVEVSQFSHSASRFENSSGAQLKCFFRAAARLPE